MGASSVTGVSGYGSVEATAKGPKERNFVGVEKLIGPRIVLAAQATIGGGGTVVYTLPEPLAGPHGAVATAWNVMTQAANAVTVTKTVVGDELVSLTLAGTPADLVDFVVVKTGLS